MNVHPAHHLRPILRVLPVGHKIPKTLLKRTELVGAAAGGVFLVAGAAKALQHNGAADAAFVYGDDLVYKVKLNCVAVGVGVVVVHLAGHAAKHRGLSGL